MAMSTISLDQMALLSASIKKFDSEYDCSTKSTEMQQKLNQYIERKAPEHIIEHMRQEIAKSKHQMCEIANKSIVSGHFIFKKCLCNYKLNNFNYLYQLYKAYKDGYLPFKGVYTEQPNQIIEIIQIIDSTYKDMLEEIKRRNKNNG